MNKVFTKKELKDKVSNVLERYFNTSLKEGSYSQIYKALAIVVKEILLEKREAFHMVTKKKKAKRVHYLSMEFLLGRSLKNNLFNLGIDAKVESILKDNNIDLQDIFLNEPDAALGNGGLGRLAACFMDSLATLDYHAMGHSILYEYGLFKQKIVNGEQVEMPDTWLPGGEVWLQPRQDKACFVRFEGRVKEVFDDKGILKPVYYDYNEIEAFPYDMMISGYNSSGVSVLRLWEAKSLNKFDMKMFSQGEYAKAISQENEVKLISKVLYPSDDHHEGKTLRLKQQYFLVSAAMQNIVTSHVERYKDITTLPNMVAIHINDTHPALCVPELMRVLLDEYYLSWDESWNIVKKITSFTNHTVLVEALETWSEDLLSSLVPRVYQILCEINRRFVKSLVDGNYGKQDIDTTSNLAVISKNKVRMANLAIVASHTVNGVSNLHTAILRKEIFKDFSSIEPNKFIGITNGIAHRRWLCQSNPLLNELLIEKIGKGFYKNYKELKNFEKFVNDEEVINYLPKIKRNNKKAFAEMLYREQGVVIDYKSRFDVHVKRIHEYKRQLLNIMKIIYLYKDLQQNPTKAFTPQTFIFGGKAASSYYMAKRIIKLINQLGEDIEKNQEISKKLKVVFIENYNVSVAEKLIPATEVSQQISLAGKEASGTGNMKFMINGALTMGTFDGANIEMSEQVGVDNMFIFGMNASEVDRTWKLGYNPNKYYEQNSKIRLVIDALNEGFNGESFSDIVNYLLNSNHLADPYMNLADFDSYLDAHYKMDKLYKSQKAWNKMSLLNIANAGFFAADRSIEEYATKVWKIKSIKVK